jgi:branched-chain amino acid transport system permease protein
MMAFVVAVIGGLGNMHGALIGGILLGLVQTWGSHYISTTLVNAIAFLSLIIVLAVRPNGLVGRSFYAARLEV